jgi:hypothetical protein
MPNVFNVQIDSIQPTQLYISSAKLDYVMKILKKSGKLGIEPIPIKKLDGQIIFVDGHTRALAALLLGFSEIPVYYWKDEDEDEKLDWEKYRVCIEWCKEEGIHRISDLKNRIVTHEDYEIVWLERCGKMQEDLQTRRKAQRRNSEST